MTMSRTGAQIRASEFQSKDIQERINRVEKHFGDLCTSFAAYARKGSRLRDKGDDVARTVRNYAEHEQLNKSLKVALKDFSENVSAIQDYRETEINRIESNVVEPLKAYGQQCKDAKEKLRQAFAARDKEAKNKKSLEKVCQEYPNSIHQIAQKKRVLKKSEDEVSEAEHNLEREIENFEGKKIHDIKNILGNFVKVELLFHTKALEIYTECYNSLELINEVEDVKEFCENILLDNNRLKSAPSLTSLSRPPTYKQAKDMPQSNDFEYESESN